MALIDFKITPGIDKQNTEYGAEGKWVDCDNVRFRYGTPENIGGWNQLGTINENELISSLTSIFPSANLKVSKLLRVSVPSFP